MEQESIKVEFAKINLKLDQLIANSSDYEARLRVLEQFKWKLMGAAAALGGVAGYLGNRIG